MEKVNISDHRCTRCGRIAAETDKFCAECGLFLRDAHIDQRLLLALVHEREGRSEEARHELQRLLQAEPNHVLLRHELQQPPERFLRQPNHLLD